MTVVKFPRKQEPSPQGWQSGELTKLTNACLTVPNSDLSSWEVGTTERGDPQLYLLGAAPEHDCILTVSRLGRLSVLEDGKGQVLFETDNHQLLVEQTCAALRKRRSQIVAKVTACWCTAREFFEEKVEPVLAEPIEIITHFAPQLAALA